MNAGAAGSYTESRQDSRALSDVVNRGRAPVGIWRCESMTRSWHDVTGWFVIDKEGVVRYALTTHWSVTDNNHEVPEVVSKL